MEVDEQQQHQQQPHGMTRRQLADMGQEQLLVMLKTSKQLLDTYSNIQSTTYQQQKLQQLQQQYLKVSQDIRSTLQQCQVLEQQEATAAAAAQQATAAAAVAADVDDGGQDSIQQLEARAAQLRQQLQQQNQLIKRAIDKLRHMVDAFNMWDSHERHLVQQSVQYAIAGAGAT